MFPAPVESSAAPPATLPSRGNASLQMAITVDDLPRHGPLPPGQSRLQVHRDLIAALKKHGVPQVYGFANTSHIDEDPDLVQALQAWVGAGYPLGNHTHTHPHMRDIGVRAYLADLDANESKLAELSNEQQDWRVFRYPFLEEGDNGEDARAVRAHLDAKGYRVAEVTIDFYDWAFNDPYVRCLASGNQAGLDALRQTFLEHAAFTLRWADAAARDLLGRPIPHVLLVHAGAFDAVMFDELLTQYETMGVEFISLDQALADPVYDIVEIPEGGVGGTLLEHLISVRGADHPPWFTHPYALLDAMCR